MDSAAAISTDRLAASIEVSTVYKPHVPMGSEPSRDDDPTGVRDLLSSLPNPDPMPEHLVERSNASLAAEQSERAARMSGPSVTPLLATSRRRPRKLVFAMAAAAAVALVATVGSTILLTRQPTTTSISAALTTTSGSRDSSGKAESSTEAKATLSATQRSLTGVQPGLAASGPTTGAAGKATVLVHGEFSGSSVEIVQSGTPYTQADFVSQARSVRDVTPELPQPSAQSGIGPAATGPGLLECLRAIGVAETPLVRADLATYEGRPAVIIVATTKGLTLAYVVDPQCSATTATVLRPATPLP
jgi:hypothetical protein